MKIMKKKFVIGSLLFALILVLSVAAWVYVNKEQGTDTVVKTVPKRSACGDVLYLEGEGEYKACEVLVATDASTSELESMLDQVNGKIVERFGSSTVYYTIEVPAGTEKKAVEYLRTKKPLILSASLNHIGRTQ